MTLRFVAVQFIQDHIHRRLQQEAATLSDDRLFHVRALFSRELLCPMRLNWESA